MINKQQFYTFILFFYIIFVFISNMQFMESSLYFKYLKYMSFPFAFVLYSKSKITNINPQIVPFLILILSSFIRINQFSTQSLFNIIFYLSGIVLFINNEKFRFPIKSSLIISIGLALIYLSTANFTFIFGKDLLNQSNAPASLSYVIGFVSLLLLLEKKYKLFIISLFILLLLPKRLVLMAIIFISIVIFSPRRLKKLILKKYALVLINLAYLFFTFILSSGIFDEFILDITGLSTGHFTSGRTTLYSFIIEESNILNNLNWIIGIGEGNTTNLLKGNFAGIYLLHNDILKIFVEHGIIIFIIFSFLLYKNGNTNQKFISLFYNFLLFADNTLIYPFAFIFYALSWMHFNNKNDNNIS